MATSATVYQDFPLLDDPKSIRLLKIINIEDTWNPTIKCSFESHNLHAKCLDFTALSYTWGPPAPTRIIEVNGHELVIRENLWHFLWQARQHRSGGHFWIDALCINQQDPGQKSAQVSMMWEIYSLAKEVLIWLGPASPNSDIGMRVLNTIGGTNVRWQPDPVTHHPPNESDWLAVADLCVRKYWTRIWILQELVFAKSIRILCGPDTAPWAALPVFLNYCLKLLFGTERRPLPAGGPGYKLKGLEYVWHSRLGPSLARRIVELKDILTNPNILDASAREMLLLERLIVQFNDVRKGGMQSSDPRDQVYALVAIAEHGDRVLQRQRRGRGDDGWKEAPGKQRPRIVPDYTKSTLEVYGAVLRHLTADAGKGRDVVMMQNAVHRLRKRLLLFSVNWERRVAVECECFPEVNFHRIKVKSYA